MHEARLTFDCGTPAHADAVLQALKPEAADGPDGSTAALTVKGGVLHADITAAHLAGLRAAINSVARLADAALRSIRY